jgi:hypothetical protein
MGAIFGKPYKLTCEASSACVMKCHVKSSELKEEKFWQLHKPDAKKGTRIRAAKKTNTINQP